MNPLRLHARNFRCFDTLDVDFPDGCVAILGDNGAGKSSLINAIYISLFGARSLADLLADSCDSDELLLELKFEHAGELYRIRRTYSPRGRGKTTLDFERFDEGEYEPLTRASTKETQELIEQTLGLSPETFRASAFLAQGDGAAFTDAQPRDRKRILAQVLGLDRYDRLQERARRDRRAAEAELQQLEGRTGAAHELAGQRPDVERQLAEVVDAFTDTADVIADLEREHAVLAEKFQEAREQQTRRQAAEAEVREAASTLAALQQRNTAADEAARAISAATLELDGLPAVGDTAALEQREAELATAVDEHARLVRDREHVQREHDRLTRERAALVELVRTTDEFAETVRVKIAETQAAPDPTCETCGQHLAGDAKAKALAAYQAELDATVEKSRHHDAEAQAIAIPEVPVEPPAPPVGELEQVRGQLRTIRDAAARRAQLEERIRQNEAAAASGPSADEFVAAKQTLASKTAELERILPVDIDEITRQGTLVKQRLETARATREQQQTTKARLEERLAQVAAAERQLAEFDTSRTQLQGHVDVYVALEQAFGRDGIPALIVENSAIPYLETEANRILAMLGTSFRVELRTQAELKSGDGVRDTLDVIVATENGERAYETFSGGERTRINLALRIALARLLANRRGAESRLLAIDEPEFLDEQGTAALVEVLRGLQDSFDKLYIVSHVPALRDSFDTTITVRDGQLVADGVFEAVPA